MRQVVTEDTDEVGLWVAEQCGGTWVSAAATAIGYYEGEELLAGVIVEDFNGVNCSMHIAGKPGTRWCHPEFISFCFHYVFDQLGCTRVTGVVEEGNSAAQRLDEHFGFELEARLKGAGKTGDLLIYVLWRENCHWLTLWRNRYEPREEKTAPRPQLHQSGRTDSCC